MDVVLFVNSGSEANDIAWRIARAVTGGTGGIATDWAYHGITDAVHALTPEEWGSGPPPENVRTWRPPDSLRGFGVDQSLEDFEFGPPIPRGSRSASLQPRSSTGC